MLIFLEFFLVNCNITVPIDKTFGRINNWIFKNIQHLFLTLNTTFSKKNDTSKYCHDKKNGRFVARILAWYFHAASYSWKIGLHICQEFFCASLSERFMYSSHTKLVVQLSMYYLKIVPRPWYFTTSITDVEILLDALKTFVNRNEYSSKVPNILMTSSRTNNIYLAKRRIVG